jgi:Divergent InlB B-repeat domain
MRMLFAGLALALVGACGGDNDVTNPPPGVTTHTLTVSGTGDGSGHVVTASGISPALDCALGANGQTSGTCSADYNEGTSVGLSATPDEGSTFSGWSGDGQGCGTADSCSIELSSSKTVVAGFSAVPVPPPADLEITSSAWYPNPEFELIDWVVEVRNNTDQIVEVARIDITTRDAAGKVLASDFTFVGPIPPGETRAHDGFADYHGTEATADFNVDDVQYTTEDQGLGLAQIVSSNWHPDPKAGEGGAIVWNVEVQNTGTMELESVEVDFVSYDANGKILDYDFTLVGPIAPGAQASAQGQADLRGGEASANFQVEGVTVSDD